MEILLESFEKLSLSEKKNVVTKLLQDNNLENQLINNFNNINLNKEHLKQIINIIQFCKIEGNKLNNLIPQWIV